MPTLDERMEFDHVVEVHADGTVSDGPSQLYAPSLYDDELDSDQWELLTGHTGQYGYAGPVMHPSEFIGGGLERRILSEPGVYVSIVAYVTPLDDDLSDDVAGWAVARFVGGE